MVSFTNATLALSIGETVEEVTDSGFLGTSPTLACSRLGEDALIQVLLNFVIRFLYSTLYMYIYTCTLFMCLYFVYSRSILMAFVTFVLTSV